MNQRSRIVMAIAAPAALLAGVFVASTMVEEPSSHGPLPLAVVSAPAAGGADCNRLMPALPADLGDYHHIDVATPAPVGATAWQRHDRSTAIVLRCGVERPREFTRASPLQVVDAVTWFEVSGDGASTWYAVDRGIYIALTIPAGSGPTPLQSISDAIVATLAARPLDPGPI